MRILDAILASPVHTAVRFEDGKKNTVRWDQQTDRYEDVCGPEWGEEDAGTVYWARSSMNLFQANGPDDWQPGTEAEEKH